MASVLCAHCGAEGAGFLCGRCLLSSFCNTACQRASWPVHKKLCRVPEPGTELAIASPPLRLRSITSTELRRMTIKEIVELFVTPLTAESARIACHALADASSNKAAAVNRAGGVQAALAALNAHPSNVGVVIESARCLSFLSITSTIASQVAEPGALSLVVATLHAHETNAKVCEYLCTVLSCISEEDATAKAAASAAALPLVVRVLDQHGGESETVSTALSAVIMFMFGRASARADAVAAGATPIVVRLLLRYATSGDYVLRFRILSVLLELTADPTSEQAGVLVDLGGLRALLKVLDGSDADMATAAAGAIDNTFLKVGAAAMLLAEGGAPIVVSMLRRHMRVADAALMLVRVSNSLTFSSEGAKATLVAAGIIPVLLSTLQLHAATGPEALVRLLCMGLRGISCPCHGGNWAAEITAGGTAVKYAEVAIRRFRTTHPETAEAASALLAQATMFTARHGL